ncbi:MAG: hypothetical protein FJ083_09170 [Cyanobacteria bacterium K_Offshore_surface_m2_239]|nr:hypothetical protein [Cyanobacteria bacterium K_Offshore_surface_m2_239]
MTPTAPHQPLGLLLALVATLPFPLAGSAAPASETALRQATEQLRQVWQQDPLTARRPFPAIRVLDSISASDCPAAAFPASGPLVLSCPGSGAVLVRRDKLDALHGVFGEAAALFVVAYGLGQSLIPAQPPAPQAPGAPAPALPAATPGLRAACAAGTLLAAVPVPAADRRLLLNNVISAGEQGFPASAAPQLGTGPQRAYALFSGMGGTSLDCGAAAMGRLASGAEPLEAFMATRGTGVGIAKFCKQPPTCPRGLSFGVAGI